MVEELIIRDRRLLSEDGIVLPIIAINKLTGRVETPPEIVTRGFAAQAKMDSWTKRGNVVVNTLEALERRRESRLGA